MRKAIYPGSFDPITFGHLDIIDRASRLFDELIIGVLYNSQKNALFSINERVSMIEELTEDYPNVRAVAFEGLLVDFAKEMQANVVVRGLRAVTDFEYEIQIAQTNKVEYPDLEIYSLNEEHAFVRSSGKNPLEIGDKISIIPNHACVVTNLAENVYGFRNGKLDRMISIDARGKSV